MDEFPEFHHLQLSFFQLYSQCIVMIETIGRDGQPGIGTGFHIGDGYLVTARHVLEDRELIGITPAGNGDINLESVEIMYPSDPTVDLALIRSDFNLNYYMNHVKFWGRDDVKKVDHIEIGGHLDDWIDNGLVLFDVVLMGYPPIPTSHPTLVA
ncbi:trypsin-like peptidase domain-containing protein, partial [Microbispora sp. NEAU-D428]|uniref:trypsin-like peptidase domain-containing protein n=1 Tax=Microbispora sitophila TaxID=2771537 RepID=UPI0018695900